MRTIPAAIQADLDAGVTTFCKLLKITLVDATIYGLTTHDQDITYLSVTYSASNGYDPSVIASDSGYAVNNAEAYALLTAEIPGITLEMVQRGELDGATWEMLLVNYTNLGHGHVILDAGDVGEVRIVDDVVYMPELVSYMMRLKSTIGLVWSNTCRAVFGTPATDGDHTGCGIDASGMWTTGTVTAVDSNDVKRSFTGDEPGTTPGRIEWLTGNNANGKIYVIEEVDGNDIAIFDIMPFDIQVNDTYRRRDDCPKTLEACRDIYDNVINMKAEPLRAIEGSAASSPVTTTPKRATYVVGTAVAL